jgi:cell division protein ZapE
LIDAGAFKADAAQEEAIRELDRLWFELITDPATGLWSRIRGRRAGPVTGLYLWGSVGRGKTWLMDLFFESLPRDDKLRIHFHRFMSKVHAALRATPPTCDPLEKIARHWASRYRVVCFDEFMVSDIADAMLLGGLLQALFDQGVTVIVTSNVAPDDLYRNGLHRSRFVPAIDALKQHTRVLQIGGSRDYRLRILQRSDTYLQPLGEAAEMGLDKAFTRISGDCRLDCRLEVNGRIVPARQRADGVIWFGFDSLCQTPRSSNDYIEIARAFSIVLLSAVPRMDDQGLDAARRFINLIDILYDHNVKLLVSAAVPAERLYGGRRLAFEFRRTASRLTEMQSDDYFAKPHLS